MTSKSGIPNVRRSSMSQQLAPLSAANRARRQSLIVSETQSSLQEEIKRKSMERLRKKRCSVGSVSDKRGLKVAIRDSRLLAARDKKAQLEAERLATTEEKMRVKKNRSEYASRRKGDETWLKVVSMGGVLRFFTENLTLRRKELRERHHAARTLQVKSLYWTSKLRKAKIKEFNVAIGDMGWKLKVNWRCRRRAMAANKLRAFFSGDVWKYFLLKNTCNMYRKHCIRIQRWIRGYIVCQKARKLSLTKIWDRIGENLYLELASVGKSGEQTADRSVVQKRESKTLSVQRKSKNNQDASREELRHVQLSRKYSAFSEALNLVDTELKRHAFHFQKADVKDTVKNVQDRRMAEVLSSRGTRDATLVRFLKQYRIEHVRAHMADYEEARSMFAHSHTHAGMNAILKEHGLVHSKHDTFPKWPMIMCYERIQKDTKFLDEIRSIIDQAWGPK